MDVATLSIALFVCVFVSYLTIKIANPIAIRVGLVDVPNQRKLHVGNIPLIGGIAVYMGVLTGSVVLFEQGPILNLYLISSGLIVLLGALDDYRDLSVSSRLSAQILIGAIMVYGAGLHLENLGGVFFGIEIKLGVIGYPLTILAILASINAFNMTDGIDGLAGTLSLVSFLSIALLMYLSGVEYYLLAVIMCAAILPYLCVNLGLLGKTRKIFMGDAGSMFVGLSIVWLLVIGSQGETRAFRPVTALWIIAVPFLDMCTITIRRLMKGHSPFRPDREHIHHIFMRLGISAKGALAVITLISLMTSAFGLYGEYADWSESFMFLSFITLFCLYFMVLKHAWKLSKRLKVFIARMRLRTGTE